MDGFGLGWKRAEKGEGNAWGEEEEGFAVRTSIGRPVLSITVCCVMGTGDAEAAVREEVVVDEEDMYKGWLRRGVALVEGGIWRRKASAVMG